MRRLLLLLLLFDIFFVLFLFHNYLCAVLRLYLIGKGAANAVCIYVRGYILFITCG